MDAPWLRIADYFHTLSIDGGAVETAKVNEALRLAGAPLAFMRASLWNKAFVGASLRLAGYACPEILGESGYRDFGEQLDEPRRGAIALLGHEIPGADLLQVGFVLRVGGGFLEVIEARDDGGVATSIYPLSLAADFRWPTETAALPQDTSLPTIATLSPADAPLHVKLSLQGIEPIRAVRYKDFAYWDNASEPLADALASGVSTPIVIESMVLGQAPALDLQGGYTGRRTPVLGKAQASPYRELAVDTGYSWDAGGLLGAADSPAIAPRQLLGPRVAMLQSMLAPDYFDLGGIDGVYGRRTRDAVLMVQSESGLPLTGVADDATWEALSVGKLRVPNIAPAEGTDGEAAPMPAAPDASLPPTGKQDDTAADLRLMQLYFATTRQPKGGDRSVEFGDGRRRELAFGTVTVNVPPPDKRRIGTLNTPDYKFLGWKVWRGSEDPDKHFFIKARGRLTRKEFCEAVSGDPSEQALVFVHGFNTTFDDAALRLAQIAADLQFEGARIFFSWPSRGGVLAYWYDRESAMFSREAFLDLLHTLQTDTRLKNIHIIAHSMGNQIVVDALATLGKSVLAKPLAEVILAAPDVDRDVFCDLGSRIKALARGVTLYASRSDRALQVSRGVAKFPRAGDVPATGPVIVPNVDTIDATAVGSELLSLNHSKFATDRSLIDDLKNLLRDGLRPPNDRTAQIIGMPVGKIPNYWRYRE